nr:uncharacterized protein LOC128688220 isoform X2 [Cherax quadricarinatus]
MIHMLILYISLLYTLLIYIWVVHTPLKLIQYCTFTCFYHQFNFIILIFLQQLSILEYRKRKSVSSENESRVLLSGPSDSSPPPSSLLCSTVLSASCADTCVSSNLSSASNTSTPEPSLSPTYLSPPQKTDRSEASESSPDLVLSPVRPLLLAPLSIILDGKSTKDEVKRDVESKCSSEGGSMSESNTYSMKGSSSNGSSSSTITTIAVALNVFTTTTSTGVTIAAATTTPTPFTTITAGNVASQDVKWNAAPTLLERQRENLTARLRREFGLCISDDDEDKSDGEDRDRGHRRHKDKNLPPPPPPPTAPPKNSIFQGREVTVQKVVCCSKPGPTQSVCNASQNMNSCNSSNINTGLHNMPTSNSQRLVSLPLHQGSCGTSMTVPGPYHGPAPSAIPLMTSGASLSQNGPASQISQGILPTAAITSTPVPVPLTSIIPPPTVPMACPVKPPKGASIPKGMQSKLSPIPSVQTLGGTSTSAHHSSSVQLGPHISSSLASQQNSAYPSRAYSRGGYSAPAAGMIPPAISLYSSSRVAPPQPHNMNVNPQGPGPVGHPPNIRPQGPPAQGLPRLVPPSLGFNGGNYSGHDCSAPGSRGS